MPEAWRDIPGYEGYYQASTLGRIRSVDRVVAGLCCSRITKGRILAQFRRFHGKSAIPYYYVDLCKQGTENDRAVHRLVALTWIGPVPLGCEVRHGPAGSLVNAVNNLCYGTRSDNEYDKKRDGTGGHRPVRRSDGIEFVGIREAARFSNCTGSRICAVCKGRMKTAGGYGWVYI